MHTMSHRLKKQLVHYLCKLLVIELGGHAAYTSLFKRIFLDVSLSAMNTLFKENKKNLVYSLFLFIAYLAALKEEAHRVGYKNAIASYAIWSYRL